MTIDEAIEVLREDLGADTYDTHPYFYKAQKLGIEALIRVRDDRDTSYQPTWYPLPSETLEGLEG